MDLLSVLASGLRAIRAPFAVGLVWLAALVLAGSLYAADRTGAFGLLAEPYRSMPSLAQMVLAALTSYVLGLVALSTTRDISRALGRRWRQALFEKAELDLRWWLATWEIWERLYPSTAVSQTIDNKVLSATLGRHDHVLLRDLLPTSLVEAELDLAALRLSKESPDQFQQYDRIASEAEFRQGLALPVFVFALVVALATQPWPWATAIVIIGLALSLFLSAQGHRRHNLARRHLLAAIGLSWTSTPALTSIREQLDEIDQHTISELRSFRAKATAIVSVTMETLQGPDLSRYISRLRHPSRAQILQEYLRRDTRSKVFGDDLPVIPQQHGLTTDGRHRSR
jgi:hypothetical protein